jgi:pyruvate formate lyase activating enzyme
MPEALLYERLDNSEVRCGLCFHRCVIPAGKRGVCRVRQNLDGRLFTLVKNRLVAANADPIEKKPLYHFLPGSKSMSVAAPGCNFRCSFCQNHEISQFEPDDEKVEITSSESVVKAALGLGCRSVSYTYTEPVVFFETALEIGVIARNSGLKNIFVTNGYITKEAASLAKEFLDAANVDLKFFDDDTYKSVCGARLDGVLEGIDNLLEIGAWVEITTLVIPGLNDTEKELRQIAKFIAGRSKDIPWHISRFHPDFKMTGSSATPLLSLELAESAGREEGLNFIYTGNVPGKSGNTICPSCGTIVIERFGFKVLSNRLKCDCCPDCGFPISGFFGWSEDRNGIPDF